MDCEVSIADSRLSNANRQWPTQIGLLRSQSS